MASIAYKNDKHLVTLFEKLEEFFNFLKIYDPYVYRQKMNLNLDEFEPTPIVQLEDYYSESNPIL